MGILIETIAETGSTNADVIARVGQGAAEGFWLRAERQNGGRGRLGRQWHSPSGNLYASTIVLLGPLDPPPHSLAYVAALAVYATIAPLLPDAVVMLKWPNDVLVDGRKICGMLLERVGDAVVVGIGINLATAPQLPDRIVTSLAQHGVGQGLTPDMLVQDLAQNLERELRAWRTYGMAALITKWLQYAHAVGDAISVTQAPSGMVSGKFAGLTDDGALRLQSDDGSITLVHAGDVEMIR